MIPDNDEHREADVLCGILGELWVLDEDNKPVKARSIVEWGEFMQGDMRVVARQTVRPGVNVSTVFLGINHQWQRGHPPVLFETMVFRSDGTCRVAGRYETWAKAVIGHVDVVQEERGATP